MMITSRTAIRRFTAALMVSTALALAPAAFAATAMPPISTPAPSEDDAFMAFANSGYTYCDATLLAGLWSIDVDKAKTTIGQKVLNGLIENIPPLLVEARRSHACSWADTPHTYEDAERLAAYWKTPEVYDAKTKVAKLYTAGRSAEVVAALAAAPAANNGAASEDQADYEAFANSSYTYCDAKLISELWTIGIGDAKATIGYKLRNGYGDLIPPILVEARQSHACTWADTGYGYEDAVALAKVWGVKEEAAKLKAAKYYTNGESAVVERALGRG
ncbi:hypothetical protein sos41_03970 [Alphaproteobacteria bacterium SO-S41]|nr:hypothetical protein sos41_03970 [Alphaproteobacteria bacterium SO-S41]